MDLTKPFIFHSKILHSRLEPVKNSFTYSNWSLVFNFNYLKLLSIPFLFGVNKFGLLSFQNKDYGYRKKNIECLKFLKDIFKKVNLSLENTSILMVTMPRVLGYIFNPVNFWLILEENSQKIKSVLCEVNNTFGQTHTYICLPNKGSSYITKEMTLKAQKVFHVSPFMPVDGHYTFKFSFEGEKLGIWINYYTKSSKKPFITSVIGNLKEYSIKNLLKALLKHPHITFRAIFLIHYQALKLFYKKVKFHKLPKQVEENVSFTQEQKESLCIKKS